MADLIPVHGPFGALTDIANPDVAAGGTGSGSQQSGGERVLVTDANVAEHAGFQEARGERTARQFKPDATVLESIGATVDQWATSKLIKRFGRPTFDNEEKIDQFEYLQHLPTVLSDSEREYFLDVAKGKQSADWAVEQITNRRTATQAMGDHAAASMLASFADPVWLVIPPALRLGKASPVAGRLTSAAASGALAAGVTAAGEGPVEDTELAMSFLMGAAAGAAFYKPGKGIIPRDADFPAQALGEALQAAEAGTQAATKPRYKLVQPERFEEFDIPAQPAKFEWQEIRSTELDAAKPRGKMIMVSEAVQASKDTRKVPAVWEQIPAELQPGAINSDPAAVVKAVDTALVQESKARGIGSKIMWNMHKTMSSYGGVGKKVADLIYDNNADLGLTSLESHREAILSGLRTHQFEYEDLLRQAMAEDGHGLMKMVNPLTSREAYAAQANIERAVQRELFRREQSARTGTALSTDGVTPRITAMADKLDAMHKQALQEMKAAGVEGAENILERAGYLNRKWNSAMIDNVIDRFQAMGLDREAAHGKVVSLVSLSLRRANAMDKAMADQIGSAIVDRALRKGYFEDGVFNTPAGAGQIKELRDILRESKMAPEEIDRAMKVLQVVSDEAGKQGFMKHRMDLDYKATVRVGNESVSVMDLIDGRVSTIVDQYAQRVSTSSAMARKGLRKPSDIEALREELLHSTPLEQRDAAAKLFDNTIAHFRGDPAGAKVDPNFRLMQAYGRSVSLAWSSLWQLTEYANAMGEYGLMKTLKYSMQELPGFKSIMNPDKQTANTLNNVLAEHSSASMRVRPFLARFEDGYEMDMGSALQLSAQTTGQLVPTANAMKYVHHHQAKVVGNLILDRLDKAAKGNADARAAMRKYGIEYPVMDKLAVEIQKHGFEVDQWDDAVWADVRPAFAKMMDASVLKSRLGDVPAFAAFDQVGKFVFTYRTFVLTAHNKVLAGGLERNGASAVGMVMLYQFPLTLAATQAKSVLNGEGVQDNRSLVKKALGQMGGLGLFSEPLKWATGESNSIGAPALIPFDRGVKLFQAGTNLDAQQGASTVLTMLPTISANPFIKGMSQQIKE